MLGTDACTECTRQELMPGSYKIPSLYFSLKVTNPERLYGVKIMKIWVMENLTLGHLYVPLILKVREVLFYAGKTHNRPFRGLFRGQCSGQFKGQKVEAPSKTPKK
jgi:hypothetical protein